ncbi:MAG: flavin reductase family protein [Dehalococcoidia bacterium]|nr:flavin reductase family protein [Dehalococcoidia bacterium]MDW8119634.1 flavin reductase family protein [Chloroflexota bacterium]
MPADKDLFRQAWGRFPTGVAIISTLEENGTPHGMTANSITSVSLDPLLVLVCVGHQRNTYRYLRQRGRFGMNFLSEGQYEAALYYAKDAKERTTPPPLTWEFAPSGTPRVAGALAFMDCVVAQTCEAGDHTLFIGRVEAIEVSPEGRPLLYYQRRFYTLPAHPLYPPPA